MIFKLFEKFEVALFQAIVVNYAVAASLGFLLADSFSFMEIFKKPWFLAACLVGSLFISLFFLMGKVAQQNGISVSSVATKMSVVIPVLFAFIVFNDTISTFKVVGILTALLAIYMVSKKQASATNQSGSLIWPLVLFIGSGILDTLLKYSQEKLIPENELELFTPTAFSAAFVFGSIALLVTKKAPKLKSITWGIVLGVPNYFSILVLLYALSYNGIESSVIFPINNMGIVLVSALVSFIWFKEHFSRQNWIGIAVAVLSISFIAFS